MPRRLNERWSTMKEVANLAGVSKITVSRVLRSPKLVSPTTREKVQNAISELGYVPEAAAGALSSGKSQIVAANISTLSGSIFLPTINKLSSILSQHGIQLILSNSEYSEEIEFQQLSALIAQRPLGLVLSNAFNSPKRRSMLSRMGCKVIEIWDLPTKPIDYAVGFSNFDAGYSMTQFLFKHCSYKKIAFLGTKQGFDRRSEMRFQGYKKFQIKHKNQIRTVDLNASGKGSIYDGTIGLNWILDKWPDTDAIFCSGDVLAIGAVCEAKRKGLSVPKDIAISGFGDIEFSNGYGIDLTTIKVRGEEIGAHVANIIIGDREEDFIENKAIDVGYDIVRRSTA
ncbi:LacI family DNA-binding transcriptional regulator [Planktomarina sp.]|nr:LacI family DNA-binding transcriptional regulator [Planktomarina sp.]